MWFWRLKAEQEKSFSRWPSFKSQFCRRTLAPMLHSFPLCLITNEASHFCTANEAVLFQTQVFVHICNTVTTYIIAIHTLVAWANKSKLHIVIDSVQTHLWESKRLIQPLLHQSAWNVQPCKWLRHVLLVWDLVLKASLCDAGFQSSSIVGGRVSILVTLHKMFHPSTPFGQNN